MMVCGVCLLQFGTVAAEQGRETEMQDAGADKAPKRVVLEDVGKVRYFKDGMCPFALSLKVCTDFLGQDYSYNYILGTSGACFRMSWNHQEWDEGNMDLGRLGPEPFRRGVRAVGFQHRFLVKKSWWPEVTGDDIDVLEGNRETEALFRERIVQSIRAGTPVLAFGVVGPPEVSIICGYDDGGEVLIGWAAMEGDHPEDQREPNGMFRQREWFAKTQGLILLKGKPVKPDQKRVYQNSLEWAFQVSTLPKSKTHVFGQAAYREWAAAMLKDLSFPDDDEKELQSRRYTVWDGMIMLAERGAAAEFLEEAAKHLPDASKHLSEAARLFREEGECCGQMLKPLGGPNLPSKPFADPCARRSAADFIDAAREKNAEAVKQLALALGKEPPGFAFDGKELKGLRPARRQMTLLGCLKGCMSFMGKDVDDAWLYGVTGAAFMLNIDLYVDVSGPTSWDHGHFHKMAPHLGISLANRVRALVADADFEEKQQAAARFVREKVDAGIPSYGWDGCLEWLVVNGHSDAACLQYSHYFGNGHRAQPWTKLGREIPHVFEVTSVEAVEPPADDKTTVRAALEFALSQRPTGRPLNPENAQGLRGYDLWIQCLENGDWRKASPPGVHHNVACWHECRCYAERFLRLAGEELGEDLKPLFEEAADHYRTVRKSLCEMGTVFPYKYPCPPVDEAGLKRALKLLRTAKDAELKGLAVIEKIVPKLGSED